MWIGFKKVLAILLSLIATDIMAWYADVDYLMVFLGAGYLFVAFYFTAHLITALSVNEHSSRIAAYSIIVVAFGWLFLELYFGITFQESTFQAKAFSYLACILIAIGTAIVFAHLTSKRVWGGVLVLLWLICLPATIALLGVADREPIGVYTYPIISPVRDVLIYGLFIGVFVSMLLWFFSLVGMLMFLLKKDLFRVSISVSVSFLLIRLVGWGLSVMVFEPYK